EAEPTPSATAQGIPPRVTISPKELLPKPPASTPPLVHDEKKLVSPTPEKPVAPPQPPIQQPPAKQPARPDALQQPKPALPTEPRRVPPPAPPPHPPAAAVSTPVPLPPALFKQPVAARVSVPVSASLRYSAPKPTLSQQIKKVTAIEETLGRDWLN